MKKIELIELIEHNLAGGDTVVDLRGKYDPRIISYHIGLVFNQIFYDTFNMNPTGLDLYAQEYTVDVSKATSGEYYSDLPVSLVQMPKNAGIRQIRGSGLLEDSETFKPTTTTQASVLARGDLGEFSTDIWFYVRGTQIFYVFMDVNITKVKMLILVPFQDLDDDTEIYIPSGKETDLFQLVVQSLSNMKPEDTRNDNVSKQI